MLTIINYGLGNINSFSNILHKLNVPFKIASQEKDLRDSTKLILPGVGSFDWALSKLNETNMRHTLDELVLEKKCPVLGICVGMQMMAKNSEEGEMKGLGWINASVKKFKPKSNDQNLLLPHMGWNNVKVSAENKLFENITLPEFYFLHSYYMLPNMEDGHEISITNYGIEFVSSIIVNNIHGVQFHPEKSHKQGTDLINNFVNI